MKRVIAVVAACVLAMAFALTGCSMGPSPTDVTKGALDALKAQDTEALQSYVSGSPEDFGVDSLATGFAGTEGKEQTDAQKAFGEKFLAVACDFDYEMGAEKIDGDTATVDVTITSHDMVPIVQAAFEEYLTEAFAMAFEGASKDEMSDLFAQIFTKKLDPDAEKTHVATTTFNLSKVDGQWKLDKLSEDNADCILGGLLGTFNSLNSSLNGTQGKAS